MSTELMEFSKGAEAGERRSSHSFDHNKLRLVADIASQAVRHEDVVTVFGELIVDGYQMNTEDCNLLAVACKHLVTTLRDGWRMVMENDEKEIFEWKKEINKEFLTRIQRDIHTLCYRVQELLDEYLIPRSTKHEERIFLLKMKADYNRYVAEVAEGDEKNKAIENAQDAYAEAFTLAVKELSPANTTRLGVALNYSVFHYEILRSQTSAYEIAATAFDEALTYASSVTDESNNDSMVLMELLRDNMQLWIDGMPGEIAPNDGGADGA